MRARPRLTYAFNFNSQQCPPEACRGYQEESRSIEIIDDDVAIIDQSMPKNNYRRNQSQVIDGLKDVPNEAGGLLNSLSETANWYCKQRRDPMDEVITSRYLSMMEEASNRDKEKNVVKPVEFPKNPEPEAPSFICPICIGPMSVGNNNKVWPCVLPGMHKESHCSSREMSYLQEETWKERHHQGVSSNNQVE
ncbi:hypothetical protein Patl1_26018 [Pistacia atlantica]|uniref:Uncharacterized protein n=1 Tax=Pistacia atlantica TaxID=434234 RepID=A0ACC1B155_9ROSI|nr:hypothetical protein Patl1_26018 [Pistacia atlantica]